MSSAISNLSLKKSRNFVRPPKVLILCYDYPPYATVGAKRPAFWAKLLPKHGWAPTVVCRKWAKPHHKPYELYRSDPPGVSVEQHGEARIHRIPYQEQAAYRFHRNDAPQYVPFRKAATLAMTRLQWSQGFKDHYHFLYKAAADLLGNEPHAAVIATGEPWLLFKHAARLSAEFNIPWIADFRDGWSTNITSSAGSVARRLLFPQSIEIDAVATAAYLTAAAEAIRDELKALHHKEVVVVSNGIDLDQFAWEQPVELRKPFTITYTGHLYPGHPVDRFLEGYDQFLDRHPDAAIHARFVGITLRETPHLPALKAFEEARPQHLSILPPVDHDASLAIQRTSALLLKFNLADQSKGFYGSKLYEYAASQRPILTLPRQPDPGSRRFLDHKDPQTMAHTPEEVAEVLEQHYAAFQSGHPIGSAVAEEDLYPISVQFSAEKLARSLDQYIPVHDAS